MSFTDKDLWVAENCASVITDLISNFQQYSIKPIKLVSLSKALNALTKYPKITITNYIEIGSSFRWKDGGLSYSSLIVASNYIQLLVGGSEYTEGVGSDSFTTLNYTSGANDDINAQKFDFWKESFFSNFSENGENLSIIDEADLLEIEDDED